MPDRRLGLAKQFPLTERSSHTNMAIAKYIWPHSSRRRRMAAKPSLPQPSSDLLAPEVIEVKAGVFKDTCLSLLDDVKGGGVEVIVTKHGQAVARLVAEHGQEPSAHGFMSGTVLGYDDIVSPDFEAWGELA